MAIARCFMPCLLGPCLVPKAMAKASIFHPYLLPAWMSCDFVGAADLNVAVGVDAVGFCVSGVASLTFCATGSCVKSHVFVRFSRRSFRVRAFLFVVAENNTLS